MIRFRRVATVFLGAGLAFWLAACASIPDSGPVRTGGPVAQVDDPLDLDFNPSPPEKGATPQRIVQGFLDAASSPKNNFAIAREHLTRSMAASWNPDESVTVDDGRNRTFEPADNRWSVEVTPLANVDSTGGYHPVTSTAPIGLSYELTKEAGEWRIAVAPNGVVIDDPTFRAVYSQQTLYFYSPDFRYLVPDARWFPARVATAPTRVVGAVLAGPSTWLTGAVTSVFPEGVQLALPSVTTVEGVARVDLSPEAGRADSAQLQRMHFQLEQSLGTLAQAVQLSIEGDAQQIVPLNDADRPLLDPQIDSDPIIASDDRFGVLTGSAIAELNGLSSRVGALQPSAVTVTASRDQAAVLSRGAAYLVRRGSDPIRVDARPGLIPPGLDNAGWVWTVPADAPGALQVAGSGGEPNQVATDWPDAVGIVSLAVSRDGARVVALLRTSSGFSLVAAGVVRGAGDVPTALTQPIELVLGDGEPSSVAWTGELTVAVLSSASGSATGIVEQTIGGGGIISTAGPAFGRIIVGAGGLSRYLVLTDKGAVQAPTGTGWQTQVDTVSAVAVQLGRP